MNTSNVKLILPERGTTLVEQMLASVGDVSWFRCFPTDVVVIKFIRKTIGASGRLLAAVETQREDQYQGKVGLVIKVGGEAFKDSDDAQFYGFKAHRGEWAVYRASEAAFEFAYVPPGTTDKVLCRVMRDSDIKGVVPDPEIIW